MANLKFGEAVRVIRERQGLTQAQLAERAKLARQSLIRIERDPSSPPWGTYQRLVNALGFTLGHDLLVAAGADLEPLQEPLPAHAEKGDAELEEAVAVSDARAMSTTSQPRWRLLA
jgi:transcriptional regulator with XRE-family HTH domain